MPGMRADMDTDMGGTPKRKRQRPEDEASSDDDRVADSDGLPEPDEELEEDPDDFDDPDATADRSRLGGDGGIDEH